MWSYHDKLAVIDSTTTRGMEDFHQKLFMNIFVEAFIHGNYQVEVGFRFNFKNVARLSAKLETMFVHATALAEEPYSRIFEVERANPLIYAIDIPNSDNLNCAIEFYLQTGKYEDKLERCKLFLLQQISHEPVFDILRTKEQLGYIVFDGIRKQTGFVGYRVVIQSERDPMYLESRIEEYLDQLHKLLSTISHEKFEKHKSSLIMKLREKHKNLNQEAGRLWSHIQSGYFEFDQNEQDSETIAGLSLADIQEFYDTFIKKDASERKKFSVHLRKADSQYENKGGNKIVTIDILESVKLKWQLGPKPCPVKPIETFLLKRS
jgi:insulysin